MIRNPHRHVSGSAVRGALATQGARLPPPRPAAQFWNEFHARRALQPVAAAEGKTADRLVWRHSGIVGWGVAAAMALAVAAGFWFDLPWRDERRNVIRSYDVGVPHRAVLILDAPGAQASILWVEGIESSTERGDGA